MANQPTHDKIAFRTLALRVLQQQYPQIAVELLDDPERVRCTGFVEEDAQVEVYLGNVRAQCSRFALDDDDQITLLQGFWTDMVERMDRETSLSWVEAQHRLRFQLVQPTAFTHPTHGDTMPSYVTRPFADDLLQVLALDWPRSISYLGIDQKQQWGVSEKQLWAIALRNLAHATHPCDVETFSRDDHTIYGPRWTDGYAAARILLPTVQAQARAWAEGDAYIAIPNQNRLLIWSKHYPPQIQQMAMEIVADMHEREGYPLSRSVFLIKRVPVRTFIPISGDKLN